jgi:hypothetical protein
VVVAHAIASIDGGRRGIDVLFAGPPGWFYAPQASRSSGGCGSGPIWRTECADLRDGVLAALRREREVETPIELATLRNGRGVHKLDLHAAASYS